jgi:hypothetical protein
MPAGFIEIAREAFGLLHPPVRPDEGADHYQRDDGREG